MPFAPVPVSTEDLVTYLSDQCGTEVNTKQLFEASEHFNCSLATVKKRLKNYKQGIGKWNLTVQEKLEQTYQAPPAMPAAAQNLIPLKDDTFVKFGNFGDIKKIILGFMLATAFLSMWISNTATSVMMLPIGIVIIKQLQDNPDFSESQRNNFAKALMLSIAYSASIGGVSTLIGTPTNMVMAGAISQIYNYDIYLIICVDTHMLYTAYVLVLDVVLQSDYS